MYSAATSLLQNQVLVPLSYLVSQSSGALASSRPALSSSVRPKSSQTHDKRSHADTNTHHDSHHKSSSDKHAYKNGTKLNQETSCQQKILSILNVEDSFNLLSNDAKYKINIFPLHSVKPPIIPSEISEVRLHSGVTTSNSSNANSNITSLSVPHSASKSLSTSVANPESNSASKVLSNTCNTQQLVQCVESFLGKGGASRLLRLYGNSSQLKEIKLWQDSLKRLLSNNTLNNVIQSLSPQQSVHSSRSSGQKWYESHISGSSFLSNKHSELLEQQPSSNTATSSLTRSQHRQNTVLAGWLRDIIIHTANTGMNVGGSRGFKTVRTGDHSMGEGMRKKFRNKSDIQATIGLVLGSQAATNSKLKSLVEETMGSGQTQVKVAFAEGYLAASGDGSGKSGDGKKQTSRTMQWIKNFQQLLAIVVLLAVLASVMNTMGGSLFRMNVNNNNEVQPEEITVSFDDVHGVDEAKAELEEIVEFLKCPEKFTSLGAELPKGVLLVGPPGTGKTLLARAVAGEAAVPFFHAAGPEFDEILVGQGARRVRDLFRAAKKRAPCVIFIDEIDSVGAKRTNSVLHPYANQTINQLLAEMDGFHKNEGVIVLGATNRRDDLDKALLRPGRFDVEVQVPIPDLAGRREIFNYYLGKVKVGHDVEVHVLARGTTGFTGADIKNVVNQAALRAAADMVDAVSMKHFEAARDKVLMGPEKKSRIPDEEVNLVTAYHEGGHTLVAHYTKHCHPLHKVTIIPRGPSLGHTAYIPAKEQYTMTRAQMLATMDSLMGGRAAEELIFGSDLVTAGASSDLKQATSVATQMVKDLGMSELVGLRTFEDASGRLLGPSEVLSTTTKESIDSEIKRLLQDSYDRARTILRSHAKEHKALAEALMKYETLDADDIKAILDGRGVTKDV